jgi:thiol-disulfide isomerase/thioredoxin
MTAGCAADHGRGGTGSSSPGRGSMHVSRGGCWLALLTLLFLLDHSPAQENGAGQDVQVKLVKYDELGDVIKQLRGKVVVVDFWATTCFPCIREFPHLVELNAKYGAKGFAAVSVSTDANPEAGETREQVLKFLRSRKATFTNLLLNEPPAVWNQKLGSDGVPVVFVFSREGQWVRKYTDDVDYAAIEKLVVELLNQK